MQAIIYQLIFLGLQLNRLAYSGSATDAHRRLWKPRSGKSHAISSEHGMSALDFEFYSKKVKAMGRWMGIRFLRNRGIPFEQAHLIVLGFPPRF